jgi:acetyl esterase/lipase
MSPEAIRKVLDTLARLNPGPAQVRFVTETMQGIPVARVRSGVEPSAGVVVWAHGGGFAFGSPRTHRALAAHVALATGWEVWIPDYPLSPEHPFPEGLDALDRVWQGGKCAGGACVLAGDSAGGNLAVALTQRLVARGEGVPDAVVVYSPWLDLAPDSLSNRQNAEAWSPFDRTDMDVYGRMYAGDIPLSDARISPLRGAFEGFPPVLIESSEVEYLRPDARLLGEALQRADVAYEERIEPLALHGWQLFPDLLPEAKRSVHALAHLLHRLQPTAASSATVSRGSASSRSASVSVRGGAKRTA